MWGVPGFSSNQFERLHQELIKRYCSFLFESAFFMVYILGGLYKVITQIGKSVITCSSANKREDIEG